MHRRGKNAGDTKAKKLFSSTYMGFLCINLQKIVCTKKLKQSILEINLITSIKEKLLYPLTQKTHAMGILQGPQCWRLIIATTGTVKRTKNIIYMCAIHYDVMGLSKKQIDLYVPIRKGLQNIKWKKKRSLQLILFRYPKQQQKCFLEKNFLKTSEIQYLHLKGKNRILQEVPTFTLYAFELSDRVSCLVRLYLYASLY